MMITEKMTDEQEVQLKKFFADILRTTIKLSKDGAQELIECFGPAIREFQITVPTDYDHATQIDTFAEKVKKLKTTYYYNDNLTSKNFAKATNKLEPGKTYIVRFHPILQTVQSEDCMNFLAKRNSILVGGQGLTLIQSLKPEEFIKGKYHISFDEKDALWVDSAGYHRVPHVNRRSDGDFEFSMGSFELEWLGISCLVSVCEMSLEG